MSLVRILAAYLQIAVSLLIGSGFAAISAVRMLFAVVKSKGGVLQVKKRDTRPSCLEDPSLGEHKFIYLEVRCNVMSKCIKGDERPRMTMEN